MIRWRMIPPAGNTKNVGDKGGKPETGIEKVFHKVKLLSEYSQAGDLPEMIGTLLPVLPKGAIKLTPA